MLSRLNTILERDRRTDRRTDGQNSYISIVRRHCVIKMQQSSYRVAKKSLCLIVHTFQTSRVIFSTLQDSILKTSA